jgi:quinoprotein relay system zinc metallohydrolase 2
MTAHLRGRNSRLAAWLLFACSAGANATPFQITEVAPGLYVHRGQDDVATRANGGDIANIGFIVGKRCVAVIDTGGTAAEGRALRLSIRALTSLPICYVINTHMHPDHIFGNAAFVRDHPQFVGSATLPEAEASHAQSYLRMLHRDLGVQADGSEIVMPTQLVQGSKTLDLGGRLLSLQTWKTAHTNNDLTVYDKSSGTLWIADLLFVQCIPVIDGSVLGWLADIKKLRGMNPRRMVPGHGPINVPWLQALDAEEAYLSSLVRDVRAAIKKGETMQQAVDTIGLDQRNHWRLFDIYHRRNVVTVYAELEWED